MRTIADADRRPWSDARGVEGKETAMGRASNAVTIGFGALASFQAALGAGAPLGNAAWGGAHAELTSGQRVGSGAAVFAYVAAICIVRGRAGGRGEPHYRWGSVVV